MNVCSKKSEEWKSSSLGVKTNLYIKKKRYVRKQVSNLSNCLTFFTFLHNVYYTIISDRGGQYFQN